MTPPVLSFLIKKHSKKLQNLYPRHDAEFNVFATLFYESENGSLYVSVYTHS